WQTLGIALPKDTDMAFRAPTCGLVPDKYRLPLLRPAAQAHSALHRFSYQFQLVETVLETPSYRWLPWRAWPEFERAFASAQARLEQSRLAAQQRIVQEELWTSQERLRQQRAADEEERRREASIKEQLRQLKLQAARERLNEALSPLQEGAQQLHTVVFDAATAIRASLQKHQALRGASARRARNMCKWFSLMNWTGDQQLER